MNIAPMRDQAGLMTDTELIRVLTLDKENFNPQFHSVAQDELSRRGISLSTFCDKVRMRHNNDPEQEATVREALALLPAVPKLWETWFFTNCLDQILYFQKEALWTTVHLVQQEGPPHACFIESETALTDTVSNFLNLEPMHGFLQNEIRLETWRIIAESDSRDFIQVLSGMLADKEIPSALAMYNEDPEMIEALYKQAIAIDPLDAIAHLNLGYLLYQHDGNDTETKDHFRKYLEMHPKAEDREQIEDILSQLQ